MAEPKRPVRFGFVYFLIALWTAILLHDFATGRGGMETIPYNQFLSYLDEQKVESVYIGSKQIQGTLKNPTKEQMPRFVTVKVDDPQLVPKLTAMKIRFEGLQESAFGMMLLSWIVPAAVFIFFWWMVLGRMGRGQGQLFSLGRSKAKIYAEKGLKTKFSDIAGVDEAKEDLQELVQFLKDPSKYGRLGGRMPKGLLLVGSPGTGKTLLARAVAGEAQVPFLSINGSEFVEMFVGLGAARVRDLFEQARSHAPCIIFIDELDALGKARGINPAGMGANDEKEQTLNQLLAELDGFDPSQGVVLLAATNRPEVLDPALLRSGRFDRQIVIDKPDRIGREAILSIHIKQIHQANGVGVAKLASLTAGFSGADLANLVNEAALIATRRGAESVEEKDFTAGIERIVGGAERKSRILSPEEKKRVAYHEMGHATVSLASGKGELVHKVSVVSRGLGALGYTMRRPTEDRYLMSRAELESQMAVLLGGRASEVLFFKEVSTGAADDLDKATDISRSMITRYGMSERLGLLTYDREVAPFLSQHALPQSHDYSEETAKAIDQESKSLVNQAFERALEIVRQYRGFVEEGVALLVEKETIDEETLNELWSKWNSPQRAMVA